MKYAQSITDLIGNTPLLRLKYASEQTGANIFGKCEFFNPSGSVKDRIALGMIQDALKNNLINEKSVIIEPTSGNTGIGLAAICASLGIRLILTMPSSMSVERRRLLIAYGAELELTLPEKGMSGAVARAQELAQQIPNSIILQQFENKANPEIHRKTTAKEILEALDGKVDVLVAGVGTGGTLTGVGEVLKQHNPKAKVIAIEPAQSPVLSGGKPGPHKIQGIGAGFVPKILNTHIYDAIITVEADVAFEEARKLAKQEGVLVGISSGANIWGAKQVALEHKGANIVTILCDTGERYLSAGLFEYSE